MQDLGGVLSDLFAGMNWVERIASVLAALTFFGSLFRLSSTRPGVWRRLMIPPALISGIIVVGFFTNLWRDPVLLVLSLVAIWVTWLGAWFKGEGVHRIDLHRAREAKEEYDNTVGILIGKGTGRDTID